MISPNERQRILGSERTRIQWQGEMMLGSAYSEEEIEAAVAAMRDSMEITKGFGFSAPPIVDFERAFADYAGTKFAISLNSAGPGLDMAMRFLDLKPGDEVIVPAINFCAAPLAVVGAGGSIVWGEVDPKTLQLDPNDVERRITPRTRAIFPVHFNGLSAPMKELIELGERHPHETFGPLPVIGDAARACGGGYRGEKIGKSGLMTIFSLHTMKNITTLGEGGMVTTDDEAVADFCRATRFYGFGAKADMWGTSNVMTKVQAAVGSAQLRKLDSFIAARRRLAARRVEWLDGIEEVSLPFEPEDCEHSYYLYTCLVSPKWAGEMRDRLMERLKGEYDVSCVVANRPVYRDRPFLRERTRGQSLPLSEELGERLFCLPIHPTMTDDENEFICAALLECVERLRSV